MSEISVRRCTPCREFGNYYFLSRLDWTQWERYDQLRRRALDTSPGLVAGCSALKCVSRALFLPHLEKLGHWLSLATDIPVSLALAPAHSGKRPGQSGSRRHVVSLDFHHKA